ncbi:N-acetylmuramoyl-L-alanine amidase [Prosthecobacter sp. SYSU 5D2]|uniref:N-acetylmuramoyl-L-alanine amidase family protein n=1 Tax=Prosthecobacter sp. SYSU 5D2 TaxID=3134134 RepID=UPI0031FE43F4
MKKSVSSSVRPWAKIGFVARSMGSYGALMAGLVSLAWHSVELEAVPSVRLEAWDASAVPLVVLDAGHGGHDGGAVAGGTLEKKLALELTLQLREKLLLKGLRVKLTRSEDVFLPLEERAAVANESEATIFVSLHLNTSSSSEVNGIETYFTERKSLAAQRALQARWALDSAAVKDERGRWLAENLQNQACLSTRAASRGIKERNYAVVSQTLMPAVLIECGFLTNAAEAERLKTEEYQNKLTEGISKGIMLFLKAHPRDSRRGIHLLAGPATAPAEEREQAAR